MARGVLDCVPAKAQTQMERIAEAEPGSAGQASHDEKLTHLGAHIARVAHELNTPASLIAGSLDNLDQYMQALMRYVAMTKPYVRREPELMDAYQIARMDYVLSNANALLAICTEGVERLNYIVDQLRIYTHAIQPTADEAVDIGSLLRRAERLSRSHRHGATPVDCAVDCLPSVVGNDQRLLHAFVNVIGNALDAVADAPHGRVQVSAARVENDGAIEIRICDNGPGVPEEIRAAIFEAFFTTKSAGAGLGLGLAIAKEAIAQSGGSIELAPRGSGGAEFVIRLPLLH